MPRRKRDDIRDQAHAAWYDRTGHCGACGEPGVFCVCTTPCGCADRHEVGCGLLADATEVFEIPVGGSVEQEGLF